MFPCGRSPLSSDSQSINVVVYIVDSTITQNIHNMCDTDTAILRKEKCHCLFQYHNQNFLLRAAASEGATQSLRNVSWMLRSPQVKLQIYLICLATMKFNKFTSFKKVKPNFFRFDPKPFHVGAIGSSKRGRSEENVELERNPGA